MGVERKTARRPEGLKLGSKHLRCIWASNADQFIASRLSRFSRSVVVLVHTFIFPFTRKALDEAYLCLEDYFLIDMIARRNA